MVSILHGILFGRLQEPYTLNALGKGNMDIGRILATPLVNMLESVTRGSKANRCGRRSWKLGRISQW